MFWNLRRYRFTNGAVSFFNSLNNNNSNNNNNATRSNNNNTAFVSKKLGYNKLSCQDEFQTNDNANIVNHNTTLTECTLDDVFDTSSTSDFDLEEEEDFSDSDIDEYLTCNVCDRSFCTQRQLDAHQQKKRHFGCSCCDTLFSSLQALEHHKEELDHWSGDETTILPCRRCQEEEEEELDDCSSQESEELERLL